ncbi:MAG TPA: hypothetical protein VF170_14575, partial [Planctomycetaceae bacterium]
MDHDRRRDQRLAALRRAAGDAERLSELARRRRYRARLQAALEAIADDGTDPDDLIAGLAATAE